MSELQRPGYGKPQTPPLLKLILLFAVIFGFYLRNYSIKSKDKYIKFTNISYQIIDLSSIYISFDMSNNSNRTGLEKIIIKIFDKNNVLLASKLTDIHLSKFKKTKYNKQINKFSRPIDKNEKLIVNIQVFKPSILK